MAGAGTTAAVVALAGCGDNNSGSDMSTPNPPNIPYTPTDVDILNFALNLEYLEAEFYLRAATGAGLPSSLRGTGAGTVNVASNTKVNFGSTLLQDLANEIAQQEVQHIQAIQATITAKGGTPVAAPNLDYTAGFTAVASGAGLPSSFNPFGDPYSFFAAALAFEDTGVMAYTGSANLISDKNVLSAAASLQAAEAYHGGLMRTMLAANAVVNNAATAMQQYAMVQAFRAKLSGGGETALSAGSVSNGKVTASTLANVDKNALAYGLSTNQVMHVVYGTMPGTYTAGGGFFPNGLNGNIKTPNA
jgi:hypothetical protein